MTRILYGKLHHTGKRRPEVLILPFCIIPFSFFTIPHSRIIKNELRTAL